MRGMYFSTNFILVNAVNHLKVELVSCVILSLIIECLHHSACNAGFLQSLENLGNLENLEKHSNFASVREKSGKKIGN